MNLTMPEFVLDVDVDREGSGRWRFAVRDQEGRIHLEAQDVEPSVQGNRLELLTVVRALESLDEPSRVTLGGCTTYIRRGMQQGLPEWRTSGFRWEAYGQMTAVRNGDLWQRFDQALRFHEVRCVQFRFDRAHGQPTAAVHFGSDTDTGGACEYSRWGLHDERVGWVGCASQSIGVWFRLNVLSVVRRMYRGFCEQWAAMFGPEGILDLR